MSKIRAYVPRVRPNLNSVRPSLHAPASQVQAALRSPQRERRRLPRRPIRRLDTYAPAPPHRGRDGRLGESRGGGGWKCSNKHGGRLQLCARGHEALRDAQLPSALAVLVRFPRRITRRLAERLDERAARGVAGGAALRRRRPGCPRDCAIAQVIPLLVEWKPSTASVGSAAALLITHQ